MIVAAETELDHAVEAVDFHPAIARRLRIRLRDARRIDVAFQRVVQRAHEVLFFQQRKEMRRLVDGDELHVETEVAAARHGEPQEIHPLAGAREVDAAGDVDPAGLPGFGLEILVELDRVLLQLRDVGVAVQRMHAAGRVPRRARRQLVALDQHHVGPTGLGEMIENAGADDAAADDGDARMALHRIWWRNSRVRACCGWPNSVAGGPPSTITPWSVK